jgi:hypothetical protein
MLELFNLLVFQKIFEERAENKLSSNAKSLYINCFFGYFLNKELSEKNSQQFEIFILEIKNYEKWKHAFVQLHQAKLISITNDRIIFLNHWGQFIDRKKLDQSQTIVIPLLDLKNSLIVNKNLYELSNRRFKIDSKKFEELIDTFTLELEATKTIHSNEQQLNKHFINWLNVYFQKNKPTSTKVNSSNKIIGLE